MTTGALWPVDLSRAPLLHHLFICSVSEVLNSERVWLVMNRLHGMNSLNSQHSMNESLCERSTVIGSANIKGAFPARGYQYRWPLVDLTWGGWNRMHTAAARWLISSHLGPKGLQRTRHIPPFPVLTKACIEDSLSCSISCLQAQFDI